MNNILNWYLKVVKNNYANFKGRARRSEFWYFVLVNAVILIILELLDNLLGTKNILYGIYSLAVLIPSLAVGFRRVQDLGKTGWLALIPIYNLILFATAGQVGPNKYGPDPKAGEHQGDVPTEPQV